MIVLSLPLSPCLQVLRFTFGGKRVRANDVYQEYIKDKGHVHMNSTSWHTLTGFVQYLGRTGKCRIDQNEKGGSLFSRVGEIHWHL